MLEDVKKRREAILEEIRILQLDFELGTMARQDFERSLDNLRHRAAIIFREQEQLEDELKRLDAQLENTILSYRSNNDKQEDQAPDPSTRPT